MKEEGGRKIEKGKEMVREKTKTVFEAAMDFIKHSYHMVKDLITGKGKVDLGEP